MNKSPLLGAVCACVCYMWISTANAAAIFTGNFSDEYGTDWELHILTDDNNLDDASHVTDIVFIPSPSSSGIDPEYLLRNGIQYSNDPTVWVGTPIDLEFTSLYPGGEYYTIEALEARGGPFGNYANCPDRFFKRCYVEDLYNEVVGEYVQDLRPVDLFGEGESETYEVYRSAFRLNYTIKPLNTEVNESDGSITFTVSRDDDSTEQTVYVSTVQNIGFTNSGDYVGKSNEPLFFAVGVDELPVTVTVLDDYVAEDTEAFRLIVQERSTDPVSVFLDSASFTILDDDTIVSTPVLSVTPTGPIDFGTVTEGASGSESLMLQNDGIDNLRVECSTTLPFSAWDFFSGSILNIAPGDTEDMTVHFNPSMEGQYSGTVNCVSSAGDVSVEVLGHGVAIQEDPEPVPDRSSKIWGIFIGLDDEGNVVTGSRADQTAVKLRKAIHDNLGVDYDQLRLITNTTPRQFPCLSGITSTCVSQAISATISQMSQNDTLIIYIGSHGGFVGLKSVKLFDFASEELSIELGTDYTDVADNRKDEETATKGDEYLILESGSLFDDDLTSALAPAEEKSIATWVFVDACFSGGFWGPDPGDNSESDDMGDLSRLSNVGFMGSTPEWFYGYTNPLDEGNSFFGGALIDSFTKNIFGKVKADINKDGRLSLHEVYRHIGGWWSEFLLDHSDDFDDMPVGFSSFTFSDETIPFRKVKFLPVMYASEGFNGRLTSSPVADAGIDQVVECTRADGAVVTLSGAASSDPEGDPLNYTWMGPFGTMTGEVVTVNLPLGTNSVMLTVDDGNGTSDDDTVQITVEDTVGPSLDTALSPDMLWPPNHKMVSIEATVVATDACDPSPSVTLRSITSNEGDGTNAYDASFDAMTEDGYTSGDIEVTADGNITLRAERAGTGTGRIYTATYSATDASGNTASAKATVTVPHNQ